MGDDHVRTQPGGLFCPGGQGSVLERARVTGGVELFDLAAAVQVPGRDVDEVGVVMEKASESVAYRAGSSDVGFLRGAYGWS